MKRAFLVAFLVLTIGGVSAAPTSRPARADWAAAVATLGRAIAANKVESLPTLLAAEVTIQRFDGKAANAGKIFSLPANRTLLFCRAYAQSPETLAGDLSDAARAWKVPDAVKSQFVIPNPEQEKRANLTAERWVGRWLGSKGNVPVGVVALWCEDRDNGNEGEVVFVLLRGHSDADGEFRITQVVFGEPLAETE